MDLKRLMKLAREQGWSVEMTGGHHLRWTPPEGPYVICPSTPSDHRSIPNTISNLRKAGLEVPRKRPKKKIR